MDLFDRTIIVRCLGYLADWLRIRKFHWCDVHGGKV